MQLPQKYYLPKADLSARSFMKTGPLSIFIIKVRGIILAYRLESIYNPKLTIVARVGASSPAIHFTSGSNGTGSALALPLVALTLKNKEIVFNKDSIKADRKKNSFFRRIFRK
jgi:hypothetical protein